MKVSSGIIDMSMNNKLRILTISSLSPVLTHQKISKDLLKLVEVVMGSIDGLLGEVGQELKGIAEYWKVDVGLVVGLNYAYEFRMVSVYCPILLDNAIYFMGMSSQNLYTVNNY